MSLAILSQVFDNFKVSINAWVMQWSHSMLIYCFDIDAIKFGMFDDCTISYRASFGKKIILLYENDQNGLKIT